MKNILSFLFIFFMVNQVNAQSQKDSTLKEVAASFEGGGANLKLLLRKNFKLPSSLANSDYQGVFVISFIVEKDGTMTIDYLNYDNMFFKSKKKVTETIVNQVKEDLLIETKRVFSQLPNWIPGIQGGKTVRSKFSMPFTIQIM
jgi:periplasmic protein TonB